LKDIITVQESNLYDMIQLENGINAEITAETATLINQLGPQKSKYYGQLLDAASDFEAAIKQVSGCAIAC